jgi:metal-responsive CopG/Arc/MetJ family transcriptional regulator
MKKVITVSLSVNLIEELDTERKHVPRSTYIEDILLQRPKWRS